MNEQVAMDKFQIWFVNPIQKLKELPNGAGGFVAFIVGVILYERLISARLSLQGQKTSDEVIRNAMAEDLHLTDDQRRVFWDMFRNGLLHQAMPKLGKTGFCFHHTFSGFPKFKLVNEQPAICIDPWKFTDRILNEFLLEPALIFESDSYPFASILPFEIK